MEENNNQIWIIVVLVGVLIWAIFFHQNTYEGQTAEEWFDEYDYQVSQNEEYKNALEEANSNIDVANSMIENAKWYSWESYEEMGDALDSLETIDTVSEP